MTGWLSQLCIQAHTSRTGADCIQTLTVSVVSARRTVVKTPTMVRHIFTPAMYTSWTSYTGLDFRWLHPVISGDSFVPKKKHKISHYNRDLSEIVSNKQLIIFPSSLYNRSYAHCRSRLAEVDPCERKWRQDCWWLSAWSVNVCGRDGWGTSSSYKWRLSSSIQRISDYKSLTATRV